MRCDGCKHWTLARRTRYMDGSIVTNYQAPEGKGHCEKLNLDFVPDFGCAAFEAAPNFTHEYIQSKAGAPWQHWVMGPCPDCGGRGSPDPGPTEPHQVAPSSACMRCAGTRNVRYYDDGFIGDERTRVHPKEKLAGLVPKPTCAACSKEMELDWIACPRCGHHIEPPAETEVVTGSLDVH